MINSQTNLTKLLLVVFLVLMILAIMVKNNPFKTTAPVSKLLPDIQSNNLSKIIFDDNEKQVVLAKNNDVWLLQRQDEEATTAALAAVDSFISALNTITEDNLVSVKKEKHSSFGLSDDEARKIELWESDKQTVLLVGKYAAGSSGNYLRLKNDDFVYKSTLLFDYYFTGEGFE